MQHIVTGVYYERADAERAVDALRADGVPVEDIYLETEVSAGPEAGWKGGEVGRLEQERRFAGLETGVLMGLALGALSGLGMSLLGGAMQEWMSRTDGGAAHTLPAVLASPWPATLAGALIGAITGALIGWVVDFTLTRLGAGPPLPAHEALVTVQTDAERLNAIRATLFRAGARHLHVGERAMA
jgi:hypothetical protein